MVTTLKTLKTRRNSVLKMPCRQTLRALTDKCVYTFAIFDYIFVLTPSLQSSLCLSVSVWTVPVCSVPSQTAVASVDFLSRDLEHILINITAASFGYT